MMDTSKFGNLYTQPTGSPTRVPSSGGGGGANAPILGGTAGSYMGGGQNTGGDPAYTNTGGAGGGGGINYNDPYAGGTMGMANVKTPAEWDWAIEQYKNAFNGGGGVNVPLPKEWRTGMNTLSGMAETGMPVDITGWWDAQQPVFATQLADYAKQAAEEAGLAGTRWSSPLQRNIVDFTQRGYDQLTAEAMARQMEADESARSRMIEGANSMLPYMKYKSDLGRANADARWAGLGGAVDLATQKYWAPLAIAGAMGSAGNNLYQQQANQNQELSNPSWVPGATGALSQAELAGRNPSFSENMLGVGGQLLSYANRGGRTAGAGSAFGSMPSPASWGSVASNPDFIPGLM